ncbi:hypothetical protein PoB_001543400 [Plakobranchus ocellatus]|uniref:Uncharacterized protein n=1 Tax=Plakobranchus ocellatus TaxID=259542 RepID=A0AAV3Z4J7_9GAST|nr:hypothetical protein PoB_001543400 [Plakobranchus ocellatus]
MASMLNEANRIDLRGAISDYNDLQEVMLTILCHETAILYLSDTDEEKSDLEKRAHHPDPMRPPMGGAVPHPFPADKEDDELDVTFTEDVSTLIMPDPGGASDKPATMST